MSKQIWSKPAVAEGGGDKKPSAVWPLSLTRRPFVVWARGPFGNYSKGSPFNTEQMFDWINATTVKLRLNEKNNISG